MRSIDRVGMSDAATTGVVVSTRLPHPDGFAVVPPQVGEGGGACNRVAATRYPELHRPRSNGRIRIHLKDYSHA